VTISVVVQQKSFENVATSKSITSTLSSGKITKREIRWIRLAKNNPCMLAENESCTRASGRPKSINRRIKDLDQFACFTQVSFIMRRKKTSTQVCGL